MNGMKNLVVTHKSIRLYTPNVTSGSTRTEIKHWLEPFFGVKLIAMNNHRTPKKSKRMRLVMHYKRMAIKLQPLTKLDVNKLSYNNDYRGGGYGVVSVNPKPNKGFFSKLLDLFENLMVMLMHDSSLSHHHFLSGNYAPVLHETPPVKDLPLIGYLPECLNGEFLRVGPNPKFAPLAGYHWFDGDGMIHGLRIKDGKATYVSRYVRTSRLQQEEYFGAPKFMKIGDLKGHFGLLAVIMQILRGKLKVLDLSYGNGTANTALVYHHGKLLALSEADKPYVIKVLEDGDLQTLGQLDYEKRLTHPFTAHPKVDPFTGEMFTYGSAHTPPYITYRVISKDGFMHDPVPITVSDPIMMHDFAITENYAIFMDLPLIFRLKEMVKENKLMFSFDTTRKARFGVLPRYAKDELLIKWFELPNCFIFHTANAWEEDDEVVMISCRIENSDLGLYSGQVKEKFDTTTSLYEMRFNMKTGLASQKQLSASHVDFPKVNKSYSGRKQRYVYGARLDDFAKVTGIVKFDLHAEPMRDKTCLEVGGNVEGLYDLGPGIFGSEAIFVPKVHGVNSEEDDGYLIFFVHDENSGKSKAHVIDAKTMSEDPIAVIDLPCRVPYGFHAFFLTEEQIQEQAEL
ncbi:carotenoid 9,10(9',10')-cleavage dioxygenase 1-like [Humulus lupulus]|uniref:carotenoid 9,10(9',10')-cleavage dioxygenase 1-like n=1 Tax=Humulus lupulus TaxID=3486 RepID=UPI002B406C00|nr:carotenoid 9,10(9',10')-cleavage dioxygenase 1-like [Humulus lupulus]